MADPLAQSIKLEARRLGFALAGITTPDPPPHASAYENWLAMGRHAQMAYLADERARTLRLDPCRILPECRSILVLGIRYPAPLSSPHFEVQKWGDRGGLGRVAAYAWGMDYHLVLPERLRALAAFIETRVGRTIPKRAYTDSGPILERDLAQRAGLGWISKNTCLINPRLGSYFLLAEILLGIQLEPDPPFESDRCGTCTRCIEACPTACILPDRSLDARRCISYLTIELKGEIPPDLRECTGEWVFGCDVCQMICPWNRFAEAAGERTFAPRPGVPRPDLIADLALSPQEFNRKFKDSPIQRARRRGYLRNVAIALGNMGEPSGIPAEVGLPVLERAMQDSEPLVRASAAWAIEQIRTRIRADPCPRDHVEVAFSHQQPRQSPRNPGPAERPGRGTLSTC